MFDFFKRRREQAKSEGRQEALEKVGQAIGQSFEAEMAEFLEQTAHPSLQRCVELFKLRTKQNVFADPDPKLEPQQSLKKEWDFFQEVLLGVAKKIKEELESRIDSFASAIGPVDRATKQAVETRYHVALGLMVDEVNEEAKSHLSTVLDIIHAQQRRGR